MNLSGEQQRKFIKIAKRSNDDSERILQDRNLKVNEELISRTGQFIPMESTITTPDVEAQSTWRSKALGALNRYERDKGGAETLSKSDIELAKLWLSSDGWKNISYSLFGQSDNRFLTVTKDGKTIDIPLTKIGRASCRERV